MTLARHQDVLELLTAAPNWGGLAGGCYDAYLDHLLPLTVTRSDRAKVASSETEQPDELTIVDSTPAYQRLWRQWTSFVRS